jgi:hypothetical protein
LLQQLAVNIGCSPTTVVAGTFPAGVIVATMKAGSQAAKVVEFKTADGGQLGTVRILLVLTLPFKWLPQACK